jgi:hypothetical protein
MNQPLEISFDFALAPSSFVIRLQATAELHHSEPFYIVDNIQVAGVRHPQHQSPALPEFEIKKIKRDGEMVWVHCDSEKESLLSMAAGEAIEKARKNLTDPGDGVNPKPKI